MKQNTPHRTGRDFTAIMKGITSHGFKVEADFASITAIDPETGKTAFQGNIDAAEQWLESLDVSEIEHFTGHDVDHGNAIFTRAVFFLILTIIFCTTGAAMRGVPGFAIGLAGAICFICGAWSFSDFRSKKI